MVLVEHLLMTQYDFNLHMVSRSVVLSSPIATCDIRGLVSRRECDFEMNFQNVIFSNFETRVFFLKTKKNHNSEEQTP